MIIELSPKKIVPNAVTIWNQHGPGIEVVMDLKNLTFGDGLLDEIYVFHVIDHLFENEILPAMINWRRCLKPGGKLFVIADDFEYLARAFVGGDISIEEFNTEFTHPTNITRDNLFGYFLRAGFKEGEIVTWQGNITGPENKILVPKQEFEIIYSALKNE